MNQIKSLRLKIKRSSVILDQNRALYQQSKETMHRNNKFMIPLLCLGAFGSTFTWAFLGKFRNPIFKAGKSLKTYITFLTRLFLY